MYSPSSNHARACLACPSSTTPHRPSYSTARTTLHHSSHVSLVGPRLVGDQYNLAGFPLSALLVPTFSSDCLTHGSRASNLESWTTGGVCPVGRARRPSMPVCWLTLCLSCTASQCCATRFCCRYPALGLLASGPAPLAADMALIAAQLSRIQVRIV